MADGALEALIPKTQELLQPLIAKPKLADKLLAKPPFRFLHDIFTALIQSNGFAKGLYNDFEMDSGNIKEKNQKTTYLDKMIMCVNQTLGKEVDVRSSKIVAGLEAENTNIFLQELARAASDSSLGWDRAVQKTLAVYPSPVDGSDGAAGAAPAEAKSSEPVERPASKGSSGPSDEEKAAAAAAAEAKARDAARKQKEKEDQERREHELKAEAQRRENEELRAKAEAKIEATRSKPDNNTDFDGGAVAQMIKEVNGDVEKTKDMMEKIISKPKMTANLLSKPPFRFLHDTVTAITKATGFGEGLYNAEELDSQNIKEKQPKIDYLNKIIQCVSVHLNIELDAKPAKIVAGLEPDDTNKFLQLLAIACKTGDSKNSVERVLSGDVALRATPTRSAESKHSAPKASTTKQSPVIEPEAKLSSRSSSPSESKRSATKEEKGSDDGSSGPSSNLGPMKALSVRGNDDEEDNTNLRQESKDSGDLERGPGSSTSSGTSRTSRPTTARRRPPKIKENVKEAGRLLAVADNKVVPTVGIMRDGDNAESDEENETPEGPSLGGGGNNSTINSDDSTSHSKLVRNILKDQKAEEEAARKQKEEEEQKEGGEDTGIRLGKRRKSHREKGKNGASSIAEVNELRASIQKICQASNPVGKLIEFAHEDLDQMAKELDKWKKEYEKKCDAYEDEKKKTEEALQPLQVQLIEVEEQIKEQIHKINTLKATIAKNEEKTQKLLRMVVSA